MRRAFRLGLLGLICCGVSLGKLPGCVPGSWMRSSDNFGLPARSGPAEAFPGTIVSAHLEEPIGPGKNVVWCSTFQLAWNEVCALIGEDIRLWDEPAMVGILNQKQASRSDLDEASYVAMAGCESVHVMVFDRPFLIMLKRAEAARPYFAMWVANAELLGRVEAMP